MPKQASVREEIVGLPDFDHGDLDAKSLPGERNFNSGGH
jgi:hypothetical protein